MNRPQLGIGAVCTVKLAYLHPRRTVQSFYTNAAHDAVVKDMLVVGQETRTVSNKKQVVCLLRHESFAPHDVYAVKKWCKVVVGCPAPEAFQTTTETAVIPPQEGEEADIRVHTSAETRQEDISQVVADGFDVDDDRNPAPENIPDDQQTQHQQEWGWDGICRRRQGQNSEHKASMKGKTEPEIKSMTFLSMFLYWFPIDYLMEVLLVQTNERLEKVGRRLTLGELLRWIGLWYYMATFKGYNRSDYFSSRPIDDFDGAPVRLNQWMSRNRFQQVLNCLFLTDRPVPAYIDKFFYVRQLIDAWNSNMNSKFHPSWISCLDESMSSWLNRWTCPGWVFCPRKPHPFGNEYHTICCGESGIMFQIEMVEGKDRPTELQQEEGK